MVLDDLRDEYSWEFQRCPWEFHGYPFLRLASTFSMDIPTNIPRNIPRLARTLRARLHWNVWSHWNKFHASLCNSFLPIFVSQWKAWNFFQMTSDSVTHFDVNEPWSIALIDTIEIFGIRCNISCRELWINPHLGKYWHWNAKTSPMLDSLTKQIVKIDHWS